MARISTTWIQALVLLICSLYLTAAHVSKTAKQQPLANPNRDPDTIIWGDADPNKHGQEVLDYSDLYLRQAILQSQPPPKWKIRTAKDDPQRSSKGRESYNRTLLPLVFEPLPLGSIRPLGWQLQQMKLMADGMPGHMHEFYRLVRDAPWVGGDREYSPLNEAWPYYWNGLVPLAYGLDDRRLKRQVLKFADWIVTHQHEDGWLGPETELERRNFWGRYPLFLGLMQLAEAEPMVTSILVASMHRFVDLMHEMLSDGHKGYVWRPGDQFDEQWGRSRAADMIIALQWLYEKHPNNNEDKLHTCMVHMYEMAYDWSYWFNEDNFLKDDLDMFPVELTNSLFPYIHGVNAGQGLKSAAVMRRINHDDALLNSTRNGVNWTFQYHGTPSGAIIGDEREAGLSPVRGTELCSVVETMFSLSYLYQALGDREFADRTELAAFNAYPVSVMPHWWAHQYLAQTNQPISHRIPNPPFWNVGPWGQTFGTEPNYPCCAVTFSTGLPKFLSASFLKDGENGIVHSLLGPAELRTVVATRNLVHIRCVTNYPFSNDLDYTIRNKSPFKFSFRVPSWADLKESGFSINDGMELALLPDHDTGLHSMIIPPGTTRLEVWFGAKIRIEQRANDTVAIYHGALLYAVPIEGEYYASRPARYPGGSAPAEANDWTILPRSPWNVAIDTSTLKFYQYPNRYDKWLPNPIWRADGPPVGISVLACEIDWNLENGYAPNPPPVGRRNCTGRAFPIELKPYGSAKLHMAELPTVDLRPGSPDLSDPTHAFLLVILVVIVIAILY